MQTLGEKSSFLTDIHQLWTDHAWLIRFRVQDIHHSHLDGQSLSEEQAVLIPVVLLDGCPVRI